ncbi:MAG TPA: redoxin domain-containing protein [Lacipirellulaceae bacterium]
MVLRLTICAASIFIATSACAGDRPPAKTVENFQLKDFRGAEHALSDYRESKLVVLAFLGTECPLAKLYGARLAELANEYEPRGVQFLGVNANVQDSITEIAAYARVHEINFPILKDVGNELADALGAVRTPEVFVLDAAREVRYHGRIDDQYGVGYTRERPQKTDLKAALDELLAGKEVTTPETGPVGCHIGRIRKADEDATVTYSNQVARILQNRCIECHRDGEIAPFGLTDYDEVVGWAPMIEEVVREGRMPPWHASKKYGEFENNRELTDDEKAAIYAWVAAGAPQGDADQLPEPRTWQGGWQLPREPDFVAPITEEPFRVKADGELRYQWCQIDPGFEEDKWVSAVEIQPGNRAVVHHVLMFAGTQDDIGEHFRGGAAGYDGIFVPGQRVRPYPHGVARRIAAGSKLIFQVHYTPNGSVQFDQSRVGMLFVDPADVEYEVRTASAVNSDLRIPPHEANHRVEAASSRLPANARLMSLTPHMHLRGKSFLYEAVMPGGEREPLLEVPRYDFSWQTAYRFAQPKPMPEGARLHCVAHFDNSADNLNNPDPTKRVRWGEQTWHEMMIGYFDYLVPVGASSAPTAEDRQKRRAEDLFDRLDKNVDGKVVVDEVPGRFQALFEQLDKDQDEALSLEELSGVASFIRQRD